jgi:hypothetical protein
MIAPQHGLQGERSDEFFQDTAQGLAAASEGLELVCRVVF